MRLRHKYTCQFSRMMFAFAAGSTFVLNLLESVVGGDGSNA